MNKQSLIDLSWDEFDEHRDSRPERNGFDQVVERAVSRRGFLGGVMAFGSGAAVFGSGVFGSTTSARAQSAAFGFDPIGIATDHNVHVLAGYQWKTLVRWGDELFSEAKDSYSAETVFRSRRRTRSLAKIQTGWNCSKLKASRYLSSTPSM